MRVALVYNLKPEEVEPKEPPDAYAEWDDLRTIHAVRDALATLHEVHLVEADEASFDSLRRLRPDFVFNIAEGTRGLSRESQVPAILEMLGIPYTGSSPLTLALCLDKARCKEILTFHGIPNPQFRIVRIDAELSGWDLFPAVVKPAMEGSSKGIRDDCLVEDPGALLSVGSRLLRDYRQAVLVEEYLPGREFTVALLGNGEEVRALPLVEIRLDRLPAGARPIYSYEAKWVWDDPERPLPIFECPADLPPSLEEEIQRVAVAAFRALDCRDWCRVDVRLDRDGWPKVIELNPLPGILPDPAQNSCFPKAARAAGLSYDELIRAVLDTAVAREARR